MEDDMEDLDTPSLSDTALDALKEFYRDRDAHEKQFEDLRSAIHHESRRSPLTMDAFAENWNESQFWYSQETATLLADQLLANSDSNTTIAVVSAPSVFVQLKNLLASNKRPEKSRPRIYLLEFDDRFSVFPEFVHYDYRKPMNLPANMKGKVDHIICDPPFLSEDCQIKAAMTVRWLSKSWAANQRPSDLSRDESAHQPVSRLIVCTGERMESLVNRIYRPQRIGTTTFMPIHAKGLSNEFRCYANFECGHWELKK